MDRRASLSLCVLLAFATSAAAKTLPIPSYITPCSRNEPDLSACVLKRGRETIPKIINGDKKYKIPVLDPLMISRLHVDEGVLGLNFTATNLEIEGLRNTILNSAVLDMEKKYGVYDLSMPRLEVHSDYEIGGRILILPITGSGRANLTLTNVTVKYTYNFEYVKKPDGSVYGIPTDSDLVFNTGRLYTRLDNLFNGNKLLGEEMNRFIEENWQELVKELGPVIGQSIGEVMKRIQQNVYELVDFDNAFPDVPV